MVSRHSFHHHITNIVPLPHPHHSGERQKYSGVQMFIGFVNKSRQAQGLYGGHLWMSWVSRSASKPHSCQRQWSPPSSPYRKGTLGRCSMCSLSSLSLLAIYCSDLCSSHNAISLQVSVHKKIWLFNLASALYIERTQHVYILKI